MALGDQLHSQPALIQDLENGLPDGGGIVGIGQHRAVSGCLPHGGAVAGDHRHADGLGLDDGHAIAFQRRAEQQQIGGCVFLLEFLLAQFGRRAEVDAMAFQHRDLVAGGLANDAKVDLKSGQGFGMLLQILVVGEADVKHAGRGVIGFRRPLPEGGGDDAGDDLNSVCRVIGAAKDVVSSRFGDRNEAVTGPQGERQPEPPFEPAFECRTLIQHPEVVDGQDHGFVTEADGGEMNVACDVEQGVAQLSDFPPNGDAVQNARGEPACGVHVRARAVLWPGVAHGAVRGFDAEIPEASGLSHDPGDAG